MRTSDESIAQKKAAMKKKAFIKQLNPGRRLQKNILATGGEKSLLSRVSLSEPFA
jgi:hypothetical protein